MQYYIQGFNASNDPVATSGSRTSRSPSRSTTQISGPAPSLPGQRAAQAVRRYGRVPARLPGLRRQEEGRRRGLREGRGLQEQLLRRRQVRRQEGERRRLREGRRVQERHVHERQVPAGKKGEGEDCDSDDECDSDKCNEGKCAEGATSNKSPKLWIGLGAQADIYFLPGGNDVCIVQKSGNPINSAGYACADPSTGQAFPNNGIPALKLSPSQANSAIIPGSKDQVVGGMLPGNIRLFLSLDYALGKNALLGLRAGYVLRTDPSSPAFPPLHLEARFTYLVGKDAVSKKGVSPMLFAGRRRRRIRRVHSGHRQPQARRRHRRSRQPGQRERLAHGRAGVLLGRRRRALAGVPQGGDDLCGQVRGRSRRRGGLLAGGRPRTRRPARSLKQAQPGRHGVRRREGRGVRMGVSLAAVP